MEKNSGILPFPVTNPQVSSAPIPVKISKLAHFHYYLYAFDAFFLVASGAVYLLVLDLVSTRQDAAAYALALLLALIAYSTYGFHTQVYDWRRCREILKKPLKNFVPTVFSFGFLLVLAFLFMVTDQFSRMWWILWFLTFCGYIVVSRAALTIYFLRAAESGVYFRKAAIIGAGDTGRNVLDHIIEFDDSRIGVVGFLDDRRERVPGAYRGVPILGGISHAETLVREHGVDMIILAIPREALARVAELLSNLSRWSVDIYMAPDKLSLEFADRPIDRVGGMHLLNLRARPIGEWNAVIKRIEDLCIAVPAIILLSPLMVFVALAIRLESKGPVLFMQDRHGFKHNIIRVFKFRSMYYRHGPEHGAAQARRRDPRITRVGQIIRKLSIDELPQLFNVIKGDMSIVGPRPHPLHMKAAGRSLQDVVVDYAGRHQVKPGITGWAQCNGLRGETDTVDKIRKRVEYDLYYIENWSIFLDIVIILRTVPQLLGHRNAY